MTTSAGEYVVRMIRRDELARVVEIQQAAFNDPRNAEMDELSQLINAEPLDGDQPSAEEKKAKRLASETELYDKQTYRYVGIYHIPHPHQPLADPKGLEEELDSSSLPSAAVMVGFGVWRRFAADAQPEAPESDAKEHAQPTLLNRFFAQMIRTRERTMKGKAYWFLKLLSIHPDHQRKGLGSLLVNWGTHRADNQAIDAWLESSPMGKGAYLKAGFQVLGIDKVDEQRAKRGFVDWPYMIHHPTRN